MIPKRWKLSWIPLALLGLGITACERAPLGTDIGLEVTEASYATSSDPGLNLVTGNIPVFSESKVIGPEGGSLGVDGFQLVVPAGAVEQDALFEFASKNNGSVHVVLHATSVVGSPEHNDVGAAGFRKAVELRLSKGFHPQGGPNAWKKYRVVEVREDGKLVPIRTAIHMASRTVIGYPLHFSDYALAQP